MRYAVFAYDDVTNKYNEYIYADYAECELALGIFSDCEVAAFICISDDFMEGKIAETLLTPGSCFNA